MSVSALVAATIAGMASAQTAQTATEFCTDYTSKCASEPNPFASTAACETFYNDAAAGTVANPAASGPTRACYQYHLSLATDTASEGTHCPHARGTSVCVVQPQTASEFCTDYTAKCASQPNPFADTAACQAAYTAAADGTLGNPITDTAAGATKACFQYHLSLATDTATEAVHCPHARGTSVCVVQAQTASEFCTDYTAKCASQPNPFADTAACEAAYTAADDGTLGDPITSTAAGPTKACFQYHLSLATDTASETVHCPHARGTSVCVGATTAGATKVAGGFVGIFAVLLALAF
jgi:hypothetical protein